MDSGNGLHELRTHEFFTKCGEDAEVKRASSGKVSPVLGVKGLSWFNYLPHFNIIRGVAIDYMHCVLLGVMKMFLSLWFVRPTEMNLSASQINYLKLIKESWLSNRQISSAGYPDL